MEMDSTNPWAVDDIDEFLHYCCPQCNVKNKSKSDFLLHAQDQHPESIAYLCKNHVKSEVEIIDEENGTLEFNDHNYTKQEYNFEEEAEKELSTNNEIGLNIQESSETYEQDFKIKEGIEVPELPEKTGTQIEISGSIPEFYSEPGSEQIICSSCRIPFINLRTFKIHYRKNHSLEESKYSKYFIIEDKSITCRKCHGKLPRTKWNSRNIIGMPIPLLKKHLKEHSLTFDNDKHDITNSMEDFENKDVNVSLLDNAPQPKKDGVELFKYKCDICKVAYFNNESLLKIHVKVMHTEHNGECYICGKIFKLKVSLLNHIYRTHEKIRHNCPHCEKKFVKSDSLKVHIINFHDEFGPPKEDHICEICQKSYNTTIQLNNHKRIHRDGEQICDECQKTFKSIMHLKSHLKRHSGIKPHQCDLCLKKFFTRSGLKYHVQQVHEKKRNILCTECGKGFNNLYKLNQHIATGEVVVFNFLFIM